MRNSAAISAGVPAPFTDLVPLRLYLDHLEEVVNNPTPETLEAYVTYDRDVFTPVVATTQSSWYDRKITSVILYDSIRLHAMLAQVPADDDEGFNRIYSENLSSPWSHGHRLQWAPAMPSQNAREHFGSDSGLRNAARCVVNSLSEHIASSGAFPVDYMPQAFEMLDQALVRLVSHDEPTLAFARKRMRLGLLHVRNIELRRPGQYHTGDHEEILQNIEQGWRIYKAPFGASWIAKIAAAISPKYR